MKPIQSVYAINEANVLHFLNLINFCLVTKWKQCAIAREIYSPIRNKIWVILQDKDEFINQQILQYAVASGPLEQLKLMWFWGLWLYWLDVFQLQFGSMQGFSCACSGNNTIMRSQDLAQRTHTTAWNLSYAAEFTLQVHIPLTVWFWPEDIRLHQQGSSFTKPHLGRFNLPFTLLYMWFYGAISWVW